jgi:hypothetical protein
MDGDQPSTISPTTPGQGSRMSERNEMRRLEILQPPAEYLCPPTVHAHLTTKEMNFQPEGTGSGSPTSIHDPPWEMGRAGKQPRLNLLDAAGAVCSSVRGDSIPALATCQRGVQRFDSASSPASIGSTHPYDLAKNGFWQGQAVTHRP